MSDEYSSIGTYQVNRWLTEKFKTLMWVNDETGVEEKVFKAYSFADPSGVNIPPMVQGGPQPQWTNLAGGPPFIVFSYSTGSGVQWERKREQAAYVIWDGNTKRLRTIQNYMINLLERVDWTAMEVNDFLGANPFDFKYFQVTTATSPDPALSEQGRQKGVVVTAFEYTRDMTQRGMRV
jgi:hypothetical protein